MIGIILCILEVIVLLSWIIFIIWGEKITEYFILKKINRETQERFNTPNKKDIEIKNRMKNGEYDIIKEMSK